LISPWIVVERVVQGYAIALRIRKKLGRNADRLAAKITGRNSDVLKYELGDSCQ